MKSYHQLSEALDHATQLLAQADTLLLTAGAGMSVDSGLPDFRGPEGLWRAYPKLAQTGLRFEQLANPSSFERDPGMAWAFYGHRLESYRSTEPHLGYNKLLQLLAAKSDAGFVVTSNVDGAFQKAGFQESRVYEIHGSIHHLQCCAPCGNAIWPATGVVIEIEQERFSAAGALPMCPRCGALARPNILLFSDWNWVADRSELQRSRFNDWLAGISAEARGVVILEIGAGTAVPSIRHLSEEISRRLSAPLIRINPGEPQCTLAGSVSLPLRALDALNRIV